MRWKHTHTNSLAGCESTPIIHVIDWKVCVSVRLCVLVRFVAHRPNACSNVTNRRTTTWKRRTIVAMLCVLGNCRPAIEYLCGAHWGIVVLAMPSRRHVHILCDLGKWGQIAASHANWIVKLVRYSISNAMHLVCRGWFMFVGNPSKFLIQHFWEIWYKTALPLEFGQKNSSSTLSDAVNSLWCVLEHLTEFEWNTQTPPVRNACFCIFCCPAPVSKHHTITCALAETGPGRTNWLHVNGVYKTRIY